MTVDNTQALSGRITPDELLTTTRAVRKRLDFDRAVPEDLIRECVAAALQAPSPSNVITMGFVVVTDAEKRRSIGKIYREIYAGYRASSAYAGRIPSADPARRAQQLRVASSADYLGEHLGDAPALIIAVNSGATREEALASRENVLPAMWSFMLAARARGLGTAWTTMHLTREREVADLLGIPFHTVAQAVLSPLAFTKGADFRPALRPDPDEVIHWDHW
jgi:nitroreductase